MRLQLPACKCRYQRRIIPAGEKTAHRHVRHQALFHRLLQSLLQSLFGLRKVLHRFFAPAQIRFPDIPVFTLPRNCSQMKDEKGSRLQLIDVTKDRFRRLDVLLKEKAGQNLSPHLFGKARAIKDRLEFRRKDQILTVLPVVERLFPDPVPHEHHFARFPVIEGDGKHSVNMIHKLLPPFQVRRKNHLRVAGGLKRITGQFLFQFLIIIDLSVKNDRQPPSLTVHRLMSGWA